MKRTWVLVADSSRARIFGADSATSSITEMKDLMHPEARQHEQKLTSDLPGSQAGGSTGSHHSVGNETEPKKHEALNFVSEITGHLEDAINKQEFEELIIIAAPSFLGLLRENLPADISRHITMELDKNLVKQSADEILQHLPKKLGWKS